MHVYAAEAGLTHQDAPASPRHTNIQGWQRVLGGWRGAGVTRSPAPWTDGRRTSRRLTSPVWARAPEEEWREAWEGTMEKEHRVSRARKRTCYDHDAQREVEKAAGEGGGRNVNTQKN